MVEFVGAIVQPSGISGEDFVESVYPTSPLEAHGSPARLAELLGLACWDEPEALIRTAAASGDVTVYEDGVQRRADPDDAVSASRLGHTVALEAGESIDPAIARASRRLARELGLSDSGCKALVVVSAKGPAVPLHVDGIEVLVVQVRGAKTWRYAANERLGFVDSGFFPGEGGSGVRDELPPLYDLGPLAFERPSLKVARLVPGSALFLPRGWWHTTECDGPSVSITFRLRNPPAYRVVADAIARRLATHGAWRAPLPGAQGSPAWRARAEETLDSLLPRLNEDLALDRASGRSLLSADRGVTVRPSPRHRIEVLRENAELRVREGDRTKRRLRLEADLVPLAAWLAGRSDAFDERQTLEVAGDAPALDAAALLQWLASSGALVLDAPIRLGRE